MLSVNKEIALVTRSSDAADRVRRPAALLIAAAVVVAYVNTLPNEFVFDTLLHVGSWEVSSLAEAAGRLVRSSRPVADATFILNHSIGGREPWSYHMVNMAVHLAACLTLLGVLRRIGQAIEDQRRSDIAPPRWGSEAFAFAVTLIWAVHPLNTQAVSYVIQRHESLMGLFFLLATYAAIRCRQSLSGLSRRMWCGCAAVACAMGMATKQPMFAAPILILLIDRTFLAGSFKRAIATRPVLYVALAATWTILLHTSHDMLIASGKNATVGMATSGVQTRLVSPVHYLLSQGEVILHYLRLSIAPYPLVLDYRWIPAYPERPDLWVPGLLIVGSLFAAAAIGVIRNKWWNVPAMGFFLILGPTSSVVPLGDLAFEHRMYLPLICVLTLLVTGGWWFLCVIQRDPAGPRIAGLSCLAVVVAVLATMTIVRNTDYRTPATMWPTVTRHAPHNWRAWYNLGIAQMLAGDHEGAIVSLKRALSLLVDPLADAHATLAEALFEAGRADEAISSQRVAVGIEPRSAERWWILGRMQLQARDAAATDSLRQATELDPQHFQAFNDLAAAHLAQRQPAKAIAPATRATELAPDFAPAWTNMGFAWLATGKLDEASAAFEQAARLQSDSDMSHINLARVRTAQKRFDESLALLNHALTLDRFSFAAMAGMKAMADAQRAAGDTEGADATVKRLIEAARAAGIPQKVLDQIGAPDSR